MHEVQKKLRYCHMGSTSQQLIPLTQNLHNQMQKWVQPTHTQNLYNQLQNWVYPNLLNQI